MPSDKEGCWPAPTVTQALLIKEKSIMSVLEKNCLWRQSVKVYACFNKNAFHLTFSFLFCFFFAVQLVQTRVKPSVDKSGAR